MRLIGLFRSVRREKIWAGAFGLVMVAGVGALAGVMPRAQAATVPTSHLTSALHWRFIGPYIGGRVTSLAGVPDKPNRFYAAYAGSGIWETDDYGRHWKVITDDNGFDAGSGAVGAVAVAPSNPKVIYAGAGDSAPRNTVLTSGGQSGGVYKSTDGGKHWTQLGLRKTNVISWILIDPKNPNIVYVAAMGHLFAPNSQRGVYKTTDGGKTWKKVLFVNDKTGAITLAMDPSNPDVVYASMWQFYRRPWTMNSGGPGSGIYKTSDGGAHWTNITHNQGLPKGVFGKVGVAVAPSEPNIVYALIQAKYKPGHPGGLFRSEDGGKTWKLMNDSLDITQRAFYYMRVYVDPKDANTIYLPNVGVYVSHNGGKKLTALHPPHGDNHAFWINPDNPDVLIEGNDGGATVSLDAGKSWSTENNQPTGQYYHANLDDQFPFHVLGAQQDEGSFASPSAVQRGGIPGVWKRKIGGEMSWVVPTPGKPDVTYGSGYYSKQWKENEKGLITNVSAWPAYKFGLKGSKIKYRYGWWHHAARFIPGTDTLLVGANVLLETKDGGLTWKPISRDLTRNDKSKQQRPGGPISADVTGEEMFDTISSIGISPVNHQVIWTGSDDGLVYVTQDGGQHWNQVRPHDLPKWSTITAVDPSYTKPGTAYVSASRYMWDDFQPYIYKTTDYGKHWTKIVSGLPDDEYTTNVRADPEVPGLLFAGTSDTVYMSLDDGSHWQPLSLNLPTVRVTDIAIQPDQHAMVVSTFGRGFWVLDNLQFVNQLSTAKVSTNAAHLFKPQQAWIVKRSVGGFGSRTRTGNAGQNLKPGANVFFYLPQNYAGQPVELTFTDANGKVVNRVHLPLQPKKTRSAFAKKEKPKKLHAGMNRFLWDLRYPDAATIKGVFHSPFGATKPVGPEVTPGTYDVVLKYGGHTERQSFQVKADPRWHASRAALQKRFALQMNIYHSLNEMNKAVNQAIDARDAVKKAIDNGNVSGSGAQKALASLNKEIDSVVNLKIQSSEGGLVFPAQLRSWLGNIQSQVGLGLVAPTRSMNQVAGIYVKQAKSATKRLKQDAAAANAGLDRGFK
jgi:photosystem II stability/assembly factor-like uncharacterized protein